jgi:hypothetical protein
MAQEPDSDLTNGAKRICGTQMDKGAKPMGRANRNSIQNILGFQNIPSSSS